MFYQFNSLSGRISQSTQSAAYNPQGLSPGQASTSEITFMSKSVKPASQPAAEMSTLKTAPTEARGTIPGASGYARIVELQKKFAVQDGTMVWTKFPKDRVFAYFTVGATVFSVGFALKNLWDMSWPKKQ